MLRGLSAVLILAALPAAGAGAREECSGKRITASIDAARPRARLAVLIRPVHRAHCRHGEPQRLGRDDRRPEVLLRCRRGTTSAVGATRSHARPPAQPVEAHRAVGRQRWIATIPMPAKQATMRTLCLATVTVCTALWLTRSRSPSMLEEVRFKESSKTV